MVSGGHLSLGQICMNIQERAPCTRILRGAADLIKGVRIVASGHGRERQIRSPLLRNRLLARELCGLRPRARARARRLGAGRACSARTEAQAFAVPWHSTTALAHSRAGP